MKLEKRLKRLGKLGRKIWNDGWRAGFSDGELANGEAFRQGYDAGYGDCKAGKLRLTGYEHGKPSPEAIAEGEAIKAARKAAFDDGYKQGYEEGQKTLHAHELPRPCDGPLYDGYGYDDYFLKVAEEFGELAAAFREWGNGDGSGDRERALLEECADLITAAISFLDKLGLGERDRSDLFRKINERNAKRDGGRRFRE